MRNSPQTLACLMNLNVSFSNLYDLKFKGKKILEDMLNAFWEREAMQKEVKTSLSLRDSIVFRSAIDNCTKYITATFVEFWEEFMKKYNDNIEVMQRNADYFRSLKEQLGSIQCQYDILLHQVVELALKISSQYQNQHTLILKFSKQIFLKYLQSNKQGEQLKELMLHIGFQTQLDNLTQQLWKNKIFAMSNQRYNPKK